MLLVEDNDGDAFLVRKALNDMDAAVELHRVDDVDQALRFLSRTGGFEEAELPDVVILDIDLPPRSGYEVLESIRKTESLAHIPVAMLSTADTLKDRAKSLQLGAVAHFGKPRNFSHYRPMLESIMGLAHKVCEKPPVQEYRRWHHRIALAH